MKQFWKDAVSIGLIYFLWFALLSWSEKIAPSLWPIRENFLGSPRWTNFDGVHYLSIAQHGYQQFQQAFFPLYPLLIRGYSTIFYTPPHVVALLIARISFFFSLLFFFRYVARENRRTAWWTIMFVLVFPTSFFFAASYTESLFLLLSVLTLLCARSRMWFLAGMFGMLAAATRFFGIFLWPLVWWHYNTLDTKRRFRDFVFVCLVPIGLVTYMTYLQLTTADAFAFFHAQPAFGAGRSGSSVILLPQVVWRYARILTTVSLGTFTYAVAALELTMFLGSVLLVYIGWRRGVEGILLLYSLLILVTPTLTGTLSSEPRYILSAFPLFYILGAQRSIIGKVFLCLVFVVGFVLLASAFLRGHFVA